MARPTKPLIEAPTTAVDEPKLANALVAARADADESLAELVELASDIGAIRAFDFNAKTCAAAQIKLFLKVKESNRFKDLPLRSDGNLRRAQTLEEFCPLAFGRSYRVMAEAEQNFELLGEQAYESANRLGLNRSSLRAMRALPPEKLTQVQAAIADGAAKGVVLAVIEDLAAEVEKGKQALQERDDEADENRKKRDGQANRIEELQKELRRFNRLPKVEQLPILQAKATGAMNDVLGGVLGALRQACQEIQQLGAEMSAPPDHNNLFLAGLFGQVLAAVNDVRSEFGLPDPPKPAEKPWLGGVAELREAQRRANAAAGEGS